MDNYCHTLCEQILNQLISAPIYEVTTLKKERISKLEDLLKNDYDLYNQILQNVSKFKGIPKRNIHEIIQGDYFLLAQLCMKILDNKYDNYNNRIQQFKIVKIKSINDLD